MTHGKVEEWNLETKKTKLWDFKTFQLSWLIMMYLLCVLVFFHLFKLCDIEGGLFFIQLLSIFIPLLFYLFQKNIKIKRKIIIGMFYLILCIGLPFIFSNTYSNPLQ